MSTLRKALGWLGIVALGLINGVLEDLLFVFVMVPYMPSSLDLTGDLFWIFTVPLAQLMALAITGTLGWLFLGLRQLPRLITFWASWTLARATFLTRINNPLEDVLVYVLWIALWCILLGFLARFAGRSNPATNPAQEA